MKKGIVIRLKWTEKIIFSIPEIFCASSILRWQGKNYWTISNPVSTNLQIKSALCKYWVATSLLLNEQSQLPAEKQAPTKQSAQTWPLGKQPPNSQTCQLEKVTLKDLTSVFAWPWNPACLSKDTLLLNQQFSNTVVKILLQNNHWYNTYNTKTETRPNICLKLTGEGHK